MLCYVLRHRRRLLISTRERFDYDTTLCKLWIDSEFTYHSVVENQFSEDDSYCKSRQTWVKQKTRLLFDDQTILAIFNSRGFNLNLTDILNFVAIKDIEYSSTSHRYFYLAKVFALFCHYISREIQEVNTYATIFVFRLECYSLKGIWIRTVWRTHCSIVWIKNIHLAILALIFFSNFHRFVEVIMIFSWISIILLRNQINRTQVACYYGYNHSLCDV